MTAQHLDIEGYWDVTILYDVWPQDLGEVGAMLSSLGAPRQMVEDAVSNLQGWNAGYTLTSMGRCESIVCIGRATSLREFLNTIDHETDHVQAHVAEYYGVALGTEQAAYLQGYVGGRLLEIVVNEIINHQYRLTA